MFKAALTGGETGYVFVSDLWSTAADNLKSHDRQFWQQLVFDDTVTPPQIAELNWSDTCELDLEVGSSADFEAEDDSQYAPVV